jgi:hypothetical protein
MTKEKTVDFLGEYTIETNAHFAHCRGFVLSEKGITFSSENREAFSERVGK